MSTHTESVKARPANRAPVPTTQLVFIALPANGPYDRKLGIKVAGNGVSVALTGPKPTATRALAWAVADLAEVYLDSKPTGCNLWIGTSAFEVSEAEAEQIRSTLNEAGLQIKGLRV